MVVLVELGCPEGVDDGERVLDAEEPYCAGKD